MRQSIPALPMRCLGPGLVALVVVSLQGCGQPPRLVQKDRVITKGTVTVDQIPLSEAAISFIHILPEKAATPDGHFIAGVTRGYFETELSPGEYRVEIRKESKEAFDDGKPIELLPEKYNAKSELKATIIDGKTNELSFQLISGN